jgi:hypothetical protein
MAHQEESPYMVKLAIVAVILPAAAWWETTDFSQAAMSEPAAYALYHSGDLASASCAAKSAAYPTSRSNDARELNDISYRD